VPGKRRRFARARSRRDPLHPFDDYCGDRQGRTPAYASSERLFRVDQDEQPERGDGDDPEALGRAGQRREHCHRAEASGLEGGDRENQQRGAGDLRVDRPRLDPEERKEQQRRRQQPGDPASGEAPSQSKRHRRGEGSQREVQDVEPGQVEGRIAPGHRDRGQRQEGDPAQAMDVRAAFDIARRRQESGQVEVVLVEIDGWGEGARGRVPDGWHRDHGSVESRDESQGGNEYEAELATGRHTVRVAG